MKSLHRIPDVIETVAREGSIGIRELSALLGFFPATTHRITSTLVERCYLKQDPEQVPMATAAAPQGRRQRGERHPGCRE
jgi:DNA-binding IclR family transcriptional regulator